MRGSWATGWAGVMGGQAHVHVKESIGRGRWFGAREGEGWHPLQECSGSGILEWGVEGAGLGHGDGIVKWCPELEGRVCVGRVGVESCTEEGDLSTAL
jgi:hypothetical protein